MCGINGYILFDKKVIESQDSIRSMAQATRHRGPDNLGTCVWENVALGHNRLSIIDLSIRGNQPMDYKDYTIIFNGEIYNFREIREKLIRAGYTFFSESDTEVLLKAYDYFGIEFVKILNGMFAFTLLDKQKKKYISFVTGWVLSRFTIIRIIQS